MISICRQICWRIKGSKFLKLQVSIWMYWISSPPKKQEKKINLRNRGLPESIPLENVRNQADKWFPTCEFCCAKCEESVLMSPCPMSLDAYEDVISGWKKSRNMEAKHKVVPVMKKNGKVIVIDCPLFSCSTFPSLSEESPIMCKNHQADLKKKKNMLLHSWNSKKVGYFSINWCIKSKCHTLH